jgi:hypothetical protein
MKTGRTALIMTISFLQILFFYSIGLAQIEGEKDTIFFSGFVKNVSWDQNSIVVAEKKLFISKDTKIIDQKGNRLKLEDIRKGVEVAIDAIRQPKGLIIREIVVITNRGV